MNIYPNPLSIATPFLLCGLGPRQSETCTATVKIGRHHSTRTDTMDPKDIHVIHTTHHLSQELFRMTATPPEVIEANKSKSQFQCTICSTTRNKLPTCQRVSMTFYFSLKNLQPYGLQCKSVWYCSKECQKKDWYANRSVFSSESSLLFRPHHKTRRTLSERPKGVQELVGALASNVTLITMLQVCAALDQES